MFLSGISIFGTNQVPGRNFTILPGQKLGKKTELSGATVTSYWQTVHVPVTLPHMPYVSTHRLACGLTQQPTMLKTFENMFSGQ